MTFSILNALEIYGPLHAKCQIFHDGLINYKSYIVCIYAYILIQQFIA